uniref:Uncharacterized protein n=1 Tax=Arion vulgaris TaxID=1028688 RepID=A0A0B6YCM8_9EUPU
MHGRFQCFKPYKKSGNTYTKINYIYTKINIGNIKGRSKQKKDTLAEHEHTNAMHSWIHS